MKSEGHRYTLVDPLPVTYYLPKGGPGYMLNTYGQQWFIEGAPND